MKKILQLIGLIVAVIILLAIAKSLKREAPITAPIDSTAGATTQTLCYYDAKTGTPGMTDVLWMDAVITGQDVTGNLHWIPAQKDSKIGTFTGILGADGTLSAVWNALAEGITNQEELLVRIYPDRAEVGFGEMTNKDSEGIWKYSDRTSIVYQTMPIVPCDALYDRTLVEKHIRQNINTIAPNQAVLGGTWYVVSVNVDPPTHTGTVVYEDGHIQEKATFSYVRNGQEVTITNTERK